MPKSNRIPAPPAAQSVDASPDIQRTIAEALEGLQAEGSPADALIGMSWFNGLSRSERAYWLEAADSAVPADAWRAFRAGGVAP